LLSIAPARKVEIALEVFAQGFVSTLKTGDASHVEDAFDAIAPLVARLKPEILARIFEPVRKVPAGWRRPLGGSFEHLSRPRQKAEAAEAPSPELWDRQVAK
jgi:hypothetical protein